MFKLVAVGGKLRGEEFSLEAGEQIFGRASDCEHQINVDGVSKRHMRLTVNKDSVYMEDLGSSNGTFINGTLSKTKTIKDGDTIALPNVIFKLVHIEERKKIITKKIAKVEDGADLELDDEVMPENILLKLVFLFKKKLMPILYSFNEQYEWRFMIAFLMFAFIIISIASTIGPVMVQGKKLLIQEITLRGRQYADEVARANSSVLGSQGNLDKVDTSFLENSEGIYSYELFDISGRIIRPIGKLNSYINDVFSIKTNEFFQKEENLHLPFIDTSLGEGEIGIAKAIKAYNSNIGREEAVGFIAIKFRPRTLAVEEANNWISFLEAVVLNSFVAIFFFGMIYYLTLRPFVEMKFQIENVLRGKRKELASELLMEEVHPLRSTVNNLLQRLRELQNDEDDETVELEDDASYIRILYDLLQGAQGPVLILDSEKRIKHLNPVCEDLLGFRESTAVDTDLLDTAREQGFAATLLDLCEQSASNDGCHQQENYELTGKDYEVHVTSLIGKDRFAKAFYITFTQEK